MSAEVLAQTLINTMTSASIYVMMAVGFTLVFGTMRIVNFAHGAAYLAGAYGMFVFGTMAGLPFVLAVLISVLVVVLASSAIEVTLVERTIDDGLKTMILTLGISLVVAGAIESIFGSTPVAVPSLAEGAYRFAGVSLPKERAIVIVAGVVVMVGLWIFLRYFRWGQGLRAVSQDKEMAAAMGVPVRKMQAWGFGGAAGLAALAGALIAPVLYSNPDIGDAALVKAFMVVIIGGVGSVSGAVLAGILVALVENIATVWLDASVSGVITFTVVILVLIAAPRGIMGRTSERV
ncbi:branched-chain amino acid ABC transporter permease [Pseudactinotalea sp.]|uniref:branched-chain amino acid ABC transporter permease n=1 Tax=Pseudactinotalea sp. TaxID=1926260 RepID=UPI003B3BAF46